MDSKTPQFDRALDAILKDLAPHERVCQQCKQKFQVEKEDIDFYRMLRVPPPKECPNCRQLTRRAFLNYTTLFKRNCDVTGHSEKIISQIPGSSPFPVYDFNHYWSGDWDAFSYGSDFKIGESFFSQFRSLLDRVPQPATTRHPMSVNSDYTSYGFQLKNCYYVFGGITSENILYGNWPIRTRETMETLLVWDCERCYEGVWLDHCYNCNFVYFSNNCLDSSFLYDCQNCDKCFGCVNLRNKKYHFLNQPLSQEEFEKRMKEIDLGDREVLCYWQAKFFELLTNSPKRITFNVRNVDSVGNLLEDCKRCYQCFFVKDGSENCRYTEMHLAAKDCMDFSLGATPTLSYECASLADASGIRFCVFSGTQCLENEYSFNLRSCSNCFGCVGLRNKRFCIFNRQYGEREYWEKVDGAKTAMLERGEYGEFFPLSFSPFPYNASLAQLSHPLSENGAVKKGLWWQEPQTSEFGGKVLSKEEVPKNIEDVKDDILDVAIKCEITGKPFRIVKEELDFYRREHLPIPTVHPAERLRDRFSWLGFFKLSEVPCVKCGSKIVGNISRNFDKNIYCQSCYNKELV